MENILPFKHWQPEIGEGVFVAPNAMVIGRAKIGRDSSIWHGAIVRADVHRIEIGECTSIQDLTMVHVTHHKRPDESDGFPTIIGSYVTVGHKVSLHGCTIEDGALVGINSTILDGAVIGKESIVAAGSLVPPGKKFPPRVMLMGSPAKIVRDLTDEEVAGLYEHAKRYVWFKNDYLEINE